MASMLGKYFLGPEDRKRYSIDYSDWLDTGEFVTNVTFEVILISGTGLAVVDGIAVNPTGLGVVYYVSQASDQSTYKILATMASSNGQVREDAILYVCRAP